MLKSFFKLFLLTLAVMLVSFKLYYRPKQEASYQIPLAGAKIHSFAIDVATVGELEAAQSISIASSIRGDLGKLIWLIPDGSYVKPGDLLVKMDTNPFEEKIEELKLKIKDQEINLLDALKTLDWEKNQTDSEKKAAFYETETAKLELNKIKNGDGPQEIARLKSSMQKAKAKYEELQAYSNELKGLETEGFLNPSEVKNAQKKLQEEQDNYLDAKMQYECYLEHVFPMLIKKSQTQLKRCHLKEEEVRKTGLFKVAKAEAALQAAEQTLIDLKHQLKSAEEEFAMAEIRAPTQGMVVHREDYRGTQKRKPRVGDVLVKNQTLLDLPDLSTMLVKTKLREIDLSKVAIDKPVSIEVDAFPNLLFKGKVSFIGILALTDFSRTGDEKFFETKVALENVNHKLRPGMTARIVIHADTIHQKLAIPCHALFEKNRQSFCYLKSNKGFIKQAVVPGSMNEQWVEIKQGVKEGDIVALVLPPSNLIIED